MGNSWEKMDFSCSLFPGQQDLATFNSFFTGIFPLIWERHLVWAVEGLYSSTPAFCKVHWSLVQLIWETGEWSNDLKQQNDIFLIPSVKIPLKKTQTQNNRATDRWVIKNAGAFVKFFSSLLQVTLPDQARSKQWRTEGQKNCSLLTDHTL